MIGELATSVTSAQMANGNRFAADQGSRPLPPQRVAFRRQREISPRSAGLFPSNRSWLT